MRHGCWTLGWETGNRQEPAGRMQPRSEATKSWILDPWPRATIIGAPLSILLVPTSKVQGGLGMGKVGNTILIPLDNQGDGRRFIAILSQHHGRYAPGGIVNTGDDTLTPGHSERTRNHESPRLRRFHLGSMRSLEQWLLSESTLRTPVRREKIQKRLLGQKLELRTVAPLRLYASQSLASCDRHIEYLS
ncbi:hypothetical protein CDEST_04747 [Colletotrichum destructivum]|uniref:Uncharacterized protein n=1 Tax=Colletotrichum destructivum TaxID=34406 RepID=A0AAX4I9T2_9PEZI|nr:hypothetical protein CDEST_04747 [Colletotrichum destructivum]